VSVLATCVHDFAVIGGLLLVGIGCFFIGVRYGEGI
jgi:hypothetical protein